MKCDDVRPAFDALVDGELAREEERILRGHLAGCPACARDLEERRAFSESLRGAFDRALDAAEPPAGTKERLAEKLHASSGRRLAVPARLAAALAFGIAVGLAAWAIGLSRPTKAQTELAARIGKAAASREEIRQMTQDIAQDLALARKSIPAGDPQDTCAMVFDAGTGVIASRMAPAAPKPAPSPVSRDPKGAISTSVNGIAVSLSQMGDGRVRLVVPGRTVQTRGMNGLLRRHGDLCVQFRVSGRDGSVTVGESTAAVDLPAQLELLRRPACWTPDVQWDAYRVWMSGKTPNAQQIEVRVKALQERCRRAVQEAPIPEVKVDLETILKDVKSLTRRQIEERQAQGEKEAGDLEARRE